MAVRPPAPFSPQLSGNINDQMRRVADAISAKADATLEPVYTAVQLIAPDGSTWRISVDTAGVLTSTLVPR
jgi:hypothetical protein